MRLAGVEECLGSWVEGLRPPPELTLSEWASRYRIMSGKASAQKGRWRTDTAPFLEEPMEALSLYSPYELVALQAPAQAGKTEVALNLIGYHIAYAPMPILMVEPTLEMVKRFSRQRLDPMLADTDVLRGLVSEQKSRDAANTLFCKDYPGGILILATAGSASNLRSMPSAVVILDEYEKYEATEEGAVLGLTKARQARFPRRKMFVPTTPLRAEHSPIVILIDSCGVAKVWHVACLKCGTYQELTYDRLRFKEPAGLIPDVVPGVEYECTSCSRLFSAEREQAAMLRNGRYHTVRDSGGRLSIGFRLPGMSVPWLPWGQLVAATLKARGNSVEEQTVANTLLGVPYSEPSDTPEWGDLFERRESYQIGTVPSGVRFLTAFCDVNEGWLAVEVVGWGRNAESWSILYREIPGDVTDPERGPWRELHNLLMQPYPVVTPDGSLGTVSIWCLGVDANYNTTTVCNWARKRTQAVFGGKAIRVNRPHTVIATKGWPGWGPAIRLAANADPTEKKRGMRLVHLSTFTLKAELYRWLRRPLPAKGEKPPHGWCHHPEYDARYFQELTAEVFKQVRGKWLFEQPSGIRNEPLDCRVGARAAAIACGVDQFSEQDWQRIEARLPPALLAAPTVELAEPAGVVTNTPEVPPVPPVHGGGPPGRRRRPTGVIGRFGGW